jgi:signal transduction histidine kinase
MAALVFLQAGVIAALLVQRRHQHGLQRSLDAALRFERALGQVSRRLADDEDTLEEAMADTLERVASQMGVDRAFVYELSPDGREVRLAFAWLAPGERPLPDAARLDEFMPLSSSLAEGQVVQIDRRTGDRRAWNHIRSLGAMGLLIAPLRAVGITVGVLGVSSLTREPEWTADHRQRLAAFAEILANILVHRRSERKLREFEAFNHTVLASHAGEVAVTDSRGVIVAANDAWTAAARASAGPLVLSAAGAVFGEGGDEGSGAVRARSQARAALRAVLESGRHDVCVEVDWDAPDGRAWSEFRVRRLDRSEGGAVMSHADITARKRAELQVQRHLHELAHLNMVAAVGQLAASVAHELNQPLTAALTNAQTLRRMMASGQSPEHLTDIVDEIIAQDKRAGEVLHRIRRLLKKETIERSPVDVNALVVDITRMFAGDAEVAGVPVVLDLGVGLPPVRGDRVQLQQVVLNLVQNAVHAARTTDARNGNGVVVRTMLEPTAVRISVADAGPGIAPDVIDRIFEPFMTTKGEGLGLGLSISRSIVELHGGRIAVRNVPEGGAEFSVLLPMDAVVA